MVELDIEPVSEQNLTFLWNNLRVVDKEELWHQAGITDDNFIENLSFKNCPHFFDSFVLTIEKEPVALFTYVVVSDHVLFLYGVGTDKIHKYRYILNIFSKKYIMSVKNKYPEFRFFAEPWDKHLDSIYWLKKLGFTETSITTRNTQNEKFILMELTDLDKIR